MRTEKDLHMAFMAWLKKQGIPYFHSRMDAKTSQTCGDPDFICVWNGQVAMVEFKFGKNRLSYDQEDRIAELEGANCCVCVTKELQEAINHVELALGLSDAAVRLTGPQNEPLAAPSTKLWLAKSRDLGDVVVSRNPEGHMGFVRLAKADDFMLPRWTEALGS